MPLDDSNIIMMRIKANILHTLQ